MSAAFFAALSFLAWVPAAWADDVRFMTPEGVLVASGDFIATDLVVTTLKTENGILSLRTAGLECVGAGCAELLDPPTFRIALSADVDPSLFPSLIEAYARDQGLELRVEGQLAVLSDTSAELVKIDLQVLDHRSTIEAFGAFQADMMLLARDLGRVDLNELRDLGLGQLNTSRQSQFVALDSLVPVTAASTAPRAIDLQEFLDILGGERTRLSGSDQPVSLHILEQGGGLWAGESFEGIADRAIRHADPDSLIEAVTQNENALGLLPASARSAFAQELELTGPCGLSMAATRLAIKAEDYPLTHPINLYLPPWRLHPEGAAFVDWLRSESAQLVIRRAGLVEISPLRIPLDAQGSRVANAILAAGADVPLEELQRMVRFLRERERLTSTFRFEPGSTRLDSQSRESVLIIASGIASGRYTGKEITLVGFSDGRGPADANRDLSFVRAETVRTAIEEALGPADPYNVVLRVESFGEALPIACDDTALGQRANRRVEIWVRDIPEE